MFISILIGGMLGCNQDDTPGGEPGTEPGEDSMVKITIVNAASNSTTRAAGTSTQPPTFEESAVDNNVRLIVYRANGYKEHDETYTVTWVDNSGIKETTISGFKLSPGKKIIYIFVNEPTTPLIDGTKTTDKEFERQIFPDAMTNNRPVIATDGRFFIGTLWGEEITIEGGSGATNPETFDLSIGRLSSKIYLNSVVARAGGILLAGTFDNAKYTLGSVAKEYYLVGQYEAGEDAPPNANHGKVTSAVHGDGATSAKFVSYNYDNPNLWTEVKTNALPFYALENTTAVNANNEQFYGNTTHFQLEVVYHPDATEIYELPTSATGALTIDADGQTTIGNNTGTFYYAKYDGIFYIFADDPTGNTYLSEFIEYEGGKNYYRSAIRDETETTDIERKNTILRNHVYKLDVLSINQLGANKPIDNKNEVIPENSEIKLQVSIYNWSIISQGVHF